MDRADVPGRPRALVRASLLALGLAALGAACQREPSCDPKQRANLDFHVKDATGATINLASYRGRPLVLNFWATWCGPCKEEIPALMALADKYKSSPLAILGISIDDTPAQLDAYAKANKVNYPLLTGAGQDPLMEAYEADLAVPISWFVRSNGCIVTKHPGIAPKDWFDQQMKALL